MQIVGGAKEPKFGYEGAGIVRRVGSKVSKFRPGDRVTGHGIDTFSTCVTGSQALYEKLPEHISFIDGACIPLVFTTALYGLVELGHLSAGQVSVKRIRVSKISINVS